MEGGDIHLLHTVWVFHRTCYRTPTVLGTGLSVYTVQKKNLVMIALLKWAQSEYICDRSLKESPKTAEGSMGLSFFWKEF